jgi:hypothetical protein
MCSGAEITQKIFFKTKKKCCYLGKKTLAYFEHKLPKWTCPIYQKILDIEKNFTFLNNTTRYTARLLDLHKYIYLLEYAIVKILFSLLSLLQNFGFLSGGTILLFLCKQFETL